jgi:hypothetical protein
MATPSEGGGFLPFSFTFVTCNLTEKTGGKRVHAENAVLAGGPFGKKNSPKNANHYLNGTRNVMLQGKARPTTIHNLLITEFNGERVVI